MPPVQGASVSRVIGLLCKRELLGLSDARGAAGPASTSGRRTGTPPAPITCGPLDPGMLPAASCRRVADTV